MWELFQVIISNSITPNQLFLLYTMREKISAPLINSKAEVINLIDKKFVEVIVKDDKRNYVLSQSGSLLVESLESYFVKAKKKTDKQIMGDNFNDMVNKYREVFPSCKLPSGKPARQNVKALSESFRWFFTTYEYTWDEIIQATKMYVNEYRNADYLYMATSQYFIAKQDKHKVKTSALADYCDMIKEGVETETKHFKENVV